MITLRTISKKVGPRDDLSWSYEIKLGNISPIRLTNVWPKGYATQRGAYNAGERAIARFKKEISQCSDTTSLSKQVKKH